MLIIEHHSVAISVAKDLFMGNTNKQNRLATFTHELAQFINQIIAR